MTDIQKTIWGRKLQLKVSFDCFEDEEILPTQKEALDNLLENWLAVDKSLDSVKQYCEEYSDGNIAAGEIINIYKYVVPKSLFVIREPKGSVALMCNFKLDPEHGLAIVFKNGKLDRICSQDEVM